MNIDTKKIKLFCDELNIDFNILDNDDHVKISKTLVYQTFLIGLEVNKLKREFIETLIKIKHYL